MKTAKFNWLDAHSRKAETVSIVLLSLGLTFTAAMNVLLFIAPKIAFTLVGIPLGISIYFLAVDLTRVLRRRRLWKHERFLPHELHPMSRDEENETMTATLELRGGEVRVVELPIDYDPRQDGGEYLMRQAVPELFAKGGLFADGWND